MLAETELKFSPRNHATKKKESAADQHSVCKILWQRSSELSNYRRFKFEIGQIDLPNMNTNDEFKSSFSSRERYSEPAHLKDWSSSEAIKTRNQASRPRLKSEKYYLVQHFGRWPVDVVSIWHHGGDNCGSLILRSYKSKPSKMDNSFWQYTLLLTKCVTKDWPRYCSVVTQMNRSSTNWRAPEKVLAWREFRRKFYWWQYHGSWGIYRDRWSDGENVSPHCHLRRVANRGTD